MGSLGHVDLTPASRHIIYLIICHALRLTLLQAPIREHYSCMYHFFLSIMLFTSHAATPEPAAPSRVPFHLKMKPTEKQLLFISGEIIKRWKSVCIELNISNAKISACSDNNPGNVEQACYSALLSWLENSESPTWGTLLDAIRGGGFRGLAAEVETKLQSGTELKKS